MGIKVVKNIRTKLWSKLLHLPIKYYNKEHSGELISRVSNDTVVVKELLPYQILVMQDGTVTGSGTHQELLDSHEFYRSLVEQQFFDK